MDNDSKPLSRIGLSLVVLRSGHPRELALWYGQLLKRTVTEEKHGQGPLHFSIQLDAAVIEFYPLRSDKLHTPMTFGLSVDVNTLEYLQATTDCKCLDEGSLLIRDPEKNQIIVQPLARFE